MRHALDRFNVVQRFDPLETIICGEWAFERGIEREHDGDAYRRRADAKRVAARIPHSPSRRERAVALRSRDDERTANRVKRRAGAACM
jgi:hypothetical protein